MSNGIDGNKLAGKIRSKGYNNTTLAKEINVDRNTIGHIINGKFNPSYHLMNSLYNILELTADEAVEIFFAKNLRDTKE